MSHSHHHGGAATLLPEGARRFALLGNPNAGKSTLFNSLTGLNAKVANYPGATVTRYLGTAKVAGTQVIVEDLPGTYSLDPISPDEQIVTELLDDTHHERPDALLALVDATSLRRSLGLVAQLQHTGIPILVVLTFCDELARRGGSIDIPGLAKALGQRVMAVTGGNRNQLADLRAAMAEVEQWPVPAVVPATEPQRVTSWINSVLRAAHYSSPQPDERTRKLDAVLLHPVWGTLIFAVTMLVFFQVIFSVAAPIQGWIEDAFAWLGGLAGQRIPIEWLAGLISDGLVGGVGGVLTYIPQIALLFLMISLLESSGYMSRAAFLMDRLMGKAGLEGRAFVAMLSGLACAVPGIMATRSLPSAKDRLVTMLTVPMMTCSARLPVYTLLIAQLVPARPAWGPIGIQGLILFGLYIYGSLGAMASAWVFKRFFGGRGNTLPFYMEMPSYRMPSVRGVGQAVWEAIKVFVSKVARIILLLSVVLWALLNLPTHSTAQMAAGGVDVNNPTAVASYRIDHSAAAAVGKAIQPVFEPLGFDWRVTVGVLASVGAREVFVATLGQIASAQNPEEPGASVAQMTWDDGPHAGQRVFTPGTTIALLLFFVFALQCTSTIAALRRESGSWKWPGFAFGYLFALAWLTALIGRVITNVFVS